MLERANEVGLEKFDPDELAVLAEVCDRYDALDPIRFSENVLGVMPWSRQADIMRAVASHSRVAVRSGHKVSKSTSAACIAIWWAKRWPGARVIITAPTDRQVRDIIWREVMRIHRTAKRPVGGRISKNPEEGLRFPDGSEVIGFATSHPEKIAGYSGPKMLFVVDEASGVDELIYEAIEGNRAGGAHILLLSNPTKTSGTFFDAFGLAREHWHCIHVSSEESPNITGERPIAGLATAEWVSEKRMEWGEDSPLYQVRVRGDFPTQAESAVIGMRAAEAAIVRGKTPYVPVDNPVHLHIGVDVARFGDDESVIQCVRGKRAFDAVVLSAMDTVQVANRVLEVARKMRHGEEVPDVKVDVIGIGAGVADYLKMFDEVRVIDVNVAESADVEEPGMPGYHRLRDQLWFTLRKWIEDDAEMPDDHRLYSELLAPTYRFSELGKIRVESKDEIKKRLKRSPDRADALALAVYPGRRTTMQNWLEANLRDL